jgi:rRNA maturation RNase YbeY
MGGTMNKPPFLIIDFSSTVKLSVAQLSSIRRMLKLASPAVARAMQREGLIPAFQGSKTVALRLSLLICGERRIKSLNQSYRGKNKVTDVLSFPAQEDPRGAWREVMLMDGVALVGDLAICHQQTVRQARQFNIKYEDEFIHLFVHGLLHLLGYDHEASIKEEQLMEEWESRILKLVADEKKRARRGP